MKLAPVAVARVKITGTYQDALQGRPSSILPSTAKNYTQIHKNLNLSKEIIVLVEADMSVKAINYTDNDYQ